MRNDQAILSKQLEAYLIIETRKINKKKQLEEFKIFGHDFTMSDIGHGTLDAVSMIAAFFPGIGTTISITADLSNAAWYYTEGKTLTAALYAIMAVPIVGDIFAWPIQMALKLGGKGLMKIPGIKQGVAHLITNSSFIKGFLLKAVGKGGTQALEKSAVNVVTKEATEKFSKELAENAIKFIERSESIYAKEGSQGIIKFLEEGLLKESQGGVKSLLGKISKEEAEKLTKNIVKAETKIGGKITEKEIKNITSEFLESVGQRLTKEESEKVSEAIMKKIADGTVKGSKEEIGKAIAKFIGERFGVVATAGMKRLIPKYGGAAGQESFSKLFDKGGGGSSAGPKSPEVMTDCPDDNIKKGCKGNNVRVIQGYLSNLGYGNPVNGNFDDATEAAVKKLQSGNNLTPSGVVNYLTIAKIEQLLTTGKQTKEQLPTPTGPATSAGSSLYENVVRRRNEQIERLVFREMVG